MAGFFMGEETQERMDLWLTRALVLLSFAAHLTLALLAGIRRRRYSGVRRSLVWLAYHVTEIGTPIALGKVFLDNTTADSEQQLKVLVAYREQQMFAFWAPFLLLHLGRPDNITCYSLENKGLSPTHIAGLVLEIGGAIYGSYKQRFMRGDGALRAAFFIMLFLGSYKYVERAVALQRASFANIRRSNKRKKLRRIDIEDKGHKRDNDDALLDAHGLLGVTKGALAQYQVKLGGYRYKISYSDWKDVSKVVEMEASLMYDMLYTKASVIHTWGGYIIRVLSPLATATALYLFHSKKGQAMEIADRMVTYILLVGTLVLDVIWLLRALGSTWTYAFLVDDTEQVEEERLFQKKKVEEERSKLLVLKQAGRRAGRQSWYWLRRLLVSLDPSGRSLRSEHRLLPGSGVGQRNLLHECTTTPRGRLEKMISFFTGLGKKKIDVKDELLEVMRMYLLVETDTIFGMHPIRELDDYMRSNHNNFSFESNLIALHIATDIFLLCKPVSPGIESKVSARYEKQIRALSDYMMFLLTQRQHMIFPLDDEASDYKKACLDLKEIWRERGTSSSTTSETELANILLDMHPAQATKYRYGERSFLTDAVDADLALKLKQDQEEHERNLLSDEIDADLTLKLIHKQEEYERSLLTVRNDTLAVGADWALKLLHELEPAGHGSERHPIGVGFINSLVHIYKVEDFILVFNHEAQKEIKGHRDSREQSELLDYMLQLILVSWVRLLSFTSVQCSRESHAKQLSCGGELLTIAWLMKHHGELNIISKRE